MNLNYRKALSGNASAHSGGQSTGYASNKFNSKRSEPNVDAIRLQGISVQTHTHTEFDQGANEKSSFEESRQGNMV